MKRLTLPFLSLLTTVLLVACGSNSSTEDTATTGDSASAEAHNEADVAFAQGMIVHHRDALTMAEMAAERASSPEVKALAERIEGAQEPEIETMSEWLRLWDEEVPEGTTMPGGDHGGHSSMPDMVMSEEEMDRLMGADGPTFDAMFLTMMTEHHRGAIEMAETLQEEGSYGPAKELAAKIAEDQRAEIDEMTVLLEQLES